MNLQLRRQVAEVRRRRYVAIADRELADGGAS